VPTSEGSDSSGSSGSDFCAAWVKVRPSTIDVWVDDSARMVRIETNVDAGRALSVESRVDYSRFGERVDISAPPKSKLVDLGSMVTSTVGTHVAVTGSWRTIAQGTERGVRWSLATAPAKTAICLDFETSVSVPLQPPITPSGPTVSRGARGHVPCVESSMVSTAELVVVSSTQSGGAIGAVAGVAGPSVRSLVAHLADGTASPIAIDPRAHTFVWVGPPAPAIDTLTADSAQGTVTCYSDPTTIFGTLVPTPPSTIALPNLFGFSCLPNAQLQELRRELKAHPPSAMPPAP
jgi:hypothetical protein